EKTFFLLEQELLEPVYMIFPGRSPELFTELPLIDRTRFEQAIFSTTVDHVEGEQALPDGFFSGEGESFGDSPFTLAAASRPANVRAVRARRRAGLEGTNKAWLALAGSAVFLGIVAFAVLFPKAFLWSLGGCTISGCAIGLILLGAAISARSGARETRGQAADAPMRWDAGGDSDVEPDSAPFFAQRPMSETSEDEEAGFDFDAGEETPSEPAAPPRVRRWFPETLLWKPELVTDDSGEVTLEFDLADSITTWRLSTSAVSGGGQLGGADFPIKVFQSFFVDFNLPVALTRNDEVGVPVVVYNYLDQRQTVELSLQEAEWFERLDAADQNGQTEGTLKLDLGPGEVRSLSFPLRVLKVGAHQLEVTATGSGVADAIRREIEVVPDGRLVEEVASGALIDPKELALEVPAGAIEGSVRAIVKLYPSNFSQLVEGLDAIFRMPSGCFEQTSSTTYPNVLALGYLRQTGKSLPAVEAKARQYIHVGYQRLVSFEVDGGGFDWFGDPPANRTLTAYGLMEFDDMARVYDVDERLIGRTRGWLLAQRKPDGSWPNERDMLDDGLAGSVNRGGDADLAATAYIGWAVFSDGQAAGRAAPTLDFLLAHPAETIDDPYLLAITANAVAAIDRNHGRLGSYLARLDQIKQTSPDGKRVWWQQAAGGRTAFHGSGRAGDIETTALATLALLTTGDQPGTARGALTWLIEQKDAAGTWHSTQATVLALKALLAGTGAALGGDQERKVDVALGGETVREIVIPADQADVMKQIDLSDMLVPGGQYPLSLADRTDTAVGYQVTFRYHVDQPPAEPRPGEEEPLSIDVTYDRQRLEVDDTVTAVATVRNNMSEPAPMVILDLPIPGGFAIDPGELAELVGSQRIARYQITPRKAIVYLRQLDPGQTLDLRYRLRATMPVKVTVPDARAYEYYDPDKRSRGGATRLEATAEA
ncbi:MAG: alpha-2-macroglobulin family protein, partial [Planctomycetota bacterium]